jgi:pyruvate-ferredoxin/flavodoxin oxidoreductase
MTYGNVYVAKVAMGSNDMQTVKAFMEAEAYDGPSIIIAYSHCIAHGINMTRGMQNQKMAVDTGYWPLFRYNPMLEAEGKNPFKLESKAPKIPLSDFTQLETRFKMLEKSHPERAKQLAALAQKDIYIRWKVYEHLAQDGDADVKEAIASAQKTPPVVEPAA